MSSSKNIRLMRSSVIYGPFSADQLRHMASTQKIKSTDLVSVDNGPWKPIKLSANEQQQKPVSQLEKPKNIAESPADPKLESDLETKPQLYSRIVDSVMEIRTNFSKNAANPTMPTQADSGNESLRLQDVTNVILNKIINNKSLSAIGFGAAIFPCLLCGFFGMSFQNNSQKPVISETSQSNEASLAIIRNMAKNKLVEISSQLESGTDAFIVRDTIFAVEAGFASISRADEVIYQANMSLTPETKAAYQSWRSSIIKAPLSPDERSKIRADREQKARERDAKRGPEEKDPPKAEERKAEPPRAEEPKATKQIPDAPRKPEKSK